MLEKIKVKEFASGKTTLDNVEQHIEQLRTQYEFNPDIIIIDYIDLLKNSARDRLEGTEDIYTSVRGLARELGLPIITPSQANRTGAKSEIIEERHEYEQANIARERNEFRLQRLEREKLERERLEMEYYEDEQSEYEDEEESKENSSKK